MDPAKSCNICQEDPLGFPSGGSADGVDLETLVMPYLNSMADFRLSIFELNGKH